MKLARAKTAELVDAYRTAAAEHRDSTVAGDYRRANKAHDRIAAIYAELRGRDERAVLLPLLTDSDARVRGWAAAHALDFAPERGEPVLTLLATGGDVAAFIAATTLDVWRKGELRFP